MPNPMVKYDIRVKGFEDSFVFSEDIFLSPESVMEFKRKKHVAAMQKHLRRRMVAKSGFLLADAAFSHAPIFPSDWRKD